MKKSEMALLTGIEVSREGVVVIVTQIKDGVSNVIRVCGEDALFLAKELNDLASEVLRKCQWYSPEDFQ